MTNLENKVNVFAGGIVAVLAGVFGQYWFLFAGFLTANVVDWLTGWYAARNAKEESSKIGAKGIVKKVWYWVVIAMAFYISFAFEKMGATVGINLSFLNAVGWFVLASYLVNEFRSILENLLRLGVNITPFLVKGLAVTDKLIDATADKSIPKSDEKERIQ